MICVVAKSTCAFRWLRSRPWVTWCCAAVAVALRKQASPMHWYVNGNNYVTLLTRTKRLRCSSVHTQMLFRFKSDDTTLEQLSRLDLENSVNSIAVHPTQKMCAIGVGNNCRIVAFDKSRKELRLLQRFFLFFVFVFKLATPLTSPTRHLWRFPILLLVDSVTLSRIFRRIFLQRMARANRHEQKAKKKSSTFCRWKRWFKSNAQRLVCFSKDGKRLVTGGADGHVRLWTLSLGASSSVALRCSWKLDGEPHGLSFVGEV